MIRDLGLALIQRSTLKEAGAALVGREPARQLSTPIDAISRVALRLNGATALDLASAMGTPDCRKALLDDLRSDAKQAATAAPGKEQEAAMLHHYAILATRPDASAATSIRRIARVRSIYTSMSSEWKTRFVRCMPRKLLRDVERRAQYDRLRRAWMLDCIATERRAAATAGLCRSQPCCRRHRR